MALFDFFKKKKNGEQTEDIAAGNNALQAEEVNVDEIEEIQETEENIEEPEIPENAVEETEEEMQQNIEIEETAEEPGEVEEEKPKRQGFFKKIISGLDKTRKNILGNVENVLKSFTKIDEELYEELEEALIMADIGVQTSMLLIESLRSRIKEGKITEAEQVKDILIDEITKVLEADSTEFKIPSPSVILVIGVNGVGKTTTIGKLAYNLKADGKKVVLAAADTFRAAAIDQLEIWGQRSDIPVIKHQENSDPASVVFDAVQAAKARKADVLICDTAGRLHNKKNLMEELRKISKIIEREYPEAHTDVFIVLDANTGQNALQQATVFKEICDITGIVLTKLDGTAKGGIVIAIKNELKIPIRFIGVGEGIDDLQPFDAAQFAKALFSEE